MALLHFIKCKEMDREKALERRLYNRAKQAGGIALKLSALHFAGIPDRLVLLPGGRVFFAELKTEGKKPSPIQKIVIKRLINLGFSVFVLDTLEAVDKLPV